MQLRSDRSRGIVGCKQRGTFKFLDAPNTRSDTTCFWITDPVGTNVASMTRCSEHNCGASVWTRIFYGFWIGCVLDFGCQWMMKSVSPNMTWQFINSDDPYVTRSLTNYSPWVSSYPPSSVGFEVRSVALFLARIGTLHWYTPNFSQVLVSGSCIMESSSTSTWSQKRRSFCYSIFRWIHYFFVLDCH